VVGVKVFPPRELRHLVLSMQLLAPETILRVSASDPCDSGRSLHESPFFRARTLEGKGGQQRRQEVRVNGIVVLAFL